MSIVLGLANVHAALLSGRIDLEKAVTSANRWFAEVFLRKPSF